MKFWALFSPLFSRRRNKAGDLPSPPRRTIGATWAMDLVDSKEEAKRLGREWIKGRMKLGEEEKRKLPNYGSILNCEKCGCRLWFAEWTQPNIKFRLQDWPTGQWAVYYHFGRAYESLMLKCNCGWRVETQVRPPEGPTTAKESRTMAQLEWQLGRGFTPHQEQKHPIME